jgi:hypothetical protein
VLSALEKYGHNPDDWEDVPTWCHATVTGTSPSGEPETDRCGLSLPCTTHPTEQS